MKIAVNDTFAVPGYGYLIVEEFFYKDRVHCTDAQGNNQLINLEWLQKNGVPDHTTFEDFQCSLFSGEEKKTRENLPQHFQRVR